MQQWHIIGAGSGWGARNMGTADGPQEILKALPVPFQKFQQTSTYWHGKEPLCFSNPMPLSPWQAQNHAKHVLEMAEDLCQKVKNITLKGHLPLVLGGDHSIAMATWSGVKGALGNEEMGLIWIDAHMDAHIPATSPSQNIHGMPIAALLGYGDDHFTNLGLPVPKLKPENLCLIGVRSFEEKEAQLLQRLGVQVYYMDDIQEKGFSTIFQEARYRISPHRFGVSIDIDAFDPEDAPGTGTPEPFGLHFVEVEKALRNLGHDPAFLGLEIAEFNPHADHHYKTRHLVWELATLITGAHR